MFFFSNSLGQILLRSAAKGLVNSSERATRLIHLADFAQSLLANDSIKKAVELLRLIPQIEPIADYYEALVLGRRGAGDLRQASYLLNNVVNEAPPLFKARATVALGTFNYCEGDYESSLKLYSEAFERATKCQDLRTIIYSSQMVGLIRSLEGDHTTALSLLENTLPMAHYYGRLYPAIYYDHLNSLAVELNELGRATEAMDACAIAIASPFAKAFPSWFETWQEIKAKQHRRPSMVSIQFKPESDAPGTELPIIDSTSNDAVIEASTMADADINNSLLESLPILQAESDSPVIESTIESGSNTNNLTILIEYLKKRNPSLFDDEMLAYIDKRKLIINLLYDHAIQVSTMTLDRIIALLNQEIAMIPEKIEVT